MRTDMTRPAAVLNLAATLALPIDAATRRLAILAMSGAGKSNTAVVMAEQMFDAGIPWVAIDPKGDWWGIRSDRSGTRPGLPIPIFGGLHADVPIEPTAIAGRELAEVIAAKRLTCVVDVSEFTDRQAMWAFLTAFGETLLHKNRAALHLFLEEADEYLPQKAREGGNLPKCLGVWERVVKRGRFRGLGSTQITQRSAALNKDTLYQAEALIAMRVTGKGDRTAIAGWVEHHNAAGEIVASLPTLADGEGWFSSPAWLRKTERVQFHRRRTFDSGSTPVVLEGQDVKPATMADIDLPALRQSFTAAVAKAKEDDPAYWRSEYAAVAANLREAERLIELLQAEPPADPQIEVVDKPVLRFGELDDIHRLLLEHDVVESQIRDLVGKMETARDDLRAALREFVAAAEHPRDTATGDSRRPEPARAAGGRPSASSERPSTGTADAPHGRSGSRSAQATPAGDVGTLPKMRRAFLTALAQHGPLQKKRILAYTGYRSSGDVSTEFAALVSEGLAHAPANGVLAITDQGRRVLGPFEKLPTGRALRDQVLANPKLSKMARAFLKALFDIYPRDIAKGELLAKTGYRSSGDVSTTFAHLVAIDYATTPRTGHLKAADMFFESVR